MIYMIAGTAAAAAATLDATRGAYAFVRFEGAGFTPATVRFTIRTDAGSARFRIDGLPASVRADRTSGTATTAGTSITLTVDPSLPRDPGAVYSTLTIVNLDAPAARPLKRMIAIRTFASPSRGKTVFESRCIACHQRDGQGVAPLLNGVFGRTAGSLRGYAYSFALKSFARHWTYALLFRWLTDTQALVPGTRMSRSQVALLSDRQRHDLIAYLASISQR